MELVNRTSGGLLGRMHSELNYAAVMKEFDGLGYFRCQHFIPHRYEGVQSVTDVTIDFTRTDRIEAFFLCHKCRSYVGVSENPNLIKFGSGVMKAIRGHEYTPYKIIDGRLVLRLVRKWTVDSGICYYAFCDAFGTELGIDDFAKSMKPWLNDRIPIDKEIVTNTLILADVSEFWPIPILRPTRTCHPLKDLYEKSRYLGRFE